MHLASFFQLALMVSALAASIRYGNEPKSDDLIHDLSLVKRHHDDAQRAAAVQEAYRHAWSGYKQYAFPNDELLPVSNGYSNSR